MIHKSVSDLTNSTSVDDLVYTAVFSSDPKTKTEARKQIHMRARKRGAIATSIYPFYAAIGRG